MAMTLFGGYGNVLDPLNRGPYGEMYLDGVASVEADFLRFSSIVFAPDAPHTITREKHEGPGHYAAQVDDGGNYNFRSVADGTQIQWTQSEFEIAFEFSRRTARFLMDNPSYMAEFIREMGTSYGQTFNSLAMAKIPETLTSGVVSNTVAYNGGTYDNKGTVALDYDSLAAAQALGDRFRTKSGMWGRANFTMLITAPENRFTADKLAQSAVIGSSNQANTLQGLLANRVYSPELTDADDWFLIDPARFRVELIVKGASNPRIFEREASRNLAITDDFSVAVNHMQRSEGIFGASV